MKKLLFASLLVAGFSFLAPSAEAGSYRTVFAGYDRCGRAVYQQVYVADRCDSRPRYYSERPVEYRSSSRGCDSDRYRDSYSRSSSRPRFAVTFGF